MQNHNFGEVFESDSQRVRRPSRAATRVRRSYDEDVIAPDIGDGGDDRVPNASSFPCIEFLTNAGLLDDFLLLIQRVGLTTYMQDEGVQHYWLTKIFVESFKFTNSSYGPVVKFKIYDEPITMSLDNFCAAIDIAPIGTARKIEGNTHGLVELYRAVTNDDSRDAHRGKIRNIQYPAIKYFVLYLATSILGRENTSNISNYHLAFLAAALNGSTTFHLGALIARRLAVSGPIYGGIVAKRVAASLGLSAAPTDTVLAPVKLDLAAMIGHHFAAPGSRKDNIVYKVFYTNGEPTEVPLPQADLFPIYRRPWSYSKEALEEQLRLRDFHQQHQEEEEAPGVQYTVTYPGASSSSHQGEDPPSSYYGGATSWEPWG